MSNKVCRYTISNWVSKKRIYIIYYCLVKETHISARKIIEHFQFVAVDITRNINASEFGKSQPGEPQRKKNEQKI